MTEEVFADRYRMSEKIGGGGMAEVYKATDTTLGREVAVKVLHPQFAQDPDFVARFRQEAQSAANLNHPNIVNIYDWGEKGGTYFIVMEYIEGKDLKQVIDSAGPLSAKKTMEITAQVASALDFAHRHEVIHRDIKPHNIVLTHGEDVKVTDFGIARRGASTMTQTGSVLGTAQYISPEQAQGRAVGPSSDIYSIGCVMYEMLTGNPPFTGDNAVAVAVKQVNEEPVPPRQINPQIPEDLQAVVLKAMSKRPEDRYGTAEELREDILLLQRGEAPSKPAAGLTSVMPAAAMAVPQPPARAAEPPKKKKVWPWVVGLIGLAVLAGVALWAISALLVPKTAEVPNVVGQTAAVAQTLLAKQGLKMNAVQGFSNNVEAGRVASQNPGGGAIIKAGGTVRVVVSKGLEEIAVPNVTTMTLQDATAKLEADGFTVGTITREFSSDVSQDTVMRQEPTAGQKLAKGEAVNLVVSKGTQDVTVPNVIGESLSSARRILGDAGLKAKIKEQTSTEESKGTVLDQDPTANNTVPINSIVTITVSSGPPMVTVPDVRNKSEATARSTLENLGFVVQVNSVPSPSANVVTQDPSPGRSVPEGSTVTIDVGDGTGP